MKRSLIHILTFVCIIMISLMAGCGPKTMTADDPAAGSQLNEAVKEAETFYYAVKLGGVVGGYVKFSVTEKNVDGREITDRHAIGIDGRIGDATKDHRNAVPPIDR